MLASRTYQKQQASGWTRIDLLLALYDGAIERLDRALVALRQGDKLSAIPLLARVQTIVLELAAGTNPETGDPSSANLMRLYEFFATSLAGTELGVLESVRRSFHTLREGFQEIRDEAIQLERSGAIPSLDGVRILSAVG
jgi:flagellin-specific chaperone FliS